jgi:hypothetical protein
MEDRRSPLRRRGRAIGIGVAGLVTVVLAARYACSHLVVRFEVARDVAITAPPEIPLALRLDKEMVVDLSSALDAKIVLDDSLHISVDHDIQVPVDLDVDVPIDTTVMVDQMLDLDVAVPVDTVLTERELNLDRITIPIDTYVLVDDDLAIDTFVPLDTTVSSVMGVSVPVKGNIPIKLTVPIKKRMHVKDVLTVAAHDLSAPLHMTLPIKTKVPIHQPIHVTGRMHVPVHQTIAIHLDPMAIKVSGAAIPVRVQLPEHVPVRVAAAIDPEIHLPERMPVQLGTVEVKASDVHFAMQ